MQKLLEKFIFQTIRHNTHLVTKVRNAISLKTY